MDINGRPQHIVRNKSPAAAPDRFLRRALDAAMGRAGWLRRCAGDNRLSGWFGGNASAADRPQWLVRRDGQDIAMADAGCLAMRRRRRCRCISGVCQTLRVRRSTGLYGSNRHRGWPNSGAADALAEPVVVMHHRLRRLDRPRRFHGPAGRDVRFDNRPCHAIRVDAPAAAGRVRCGGRYYVCL